MTQLTRKVARMNPLIPLHNYDWSALADGEEKTTTRTGPPASEALISLAERIDESATHERKEQGNA